MGMKLFNSCLAVVFLSAFVSLYIQWPGLHGYNGLLPAQDFISRIQPHLHAYPYNGFLAFPSLLLFAERIGVSVDALAETLLFVGSTSAIVASCGYHSPILFALMWICYLSLYLVGQTFLSFQWDILLLEVGAIGICTSLAPQNSSFPWMIRFLAWKLMFMAGVVKLQAACPTWEQLTALEYHFATQPLPHPLSYVAHQLHPLLLRLGVAGTLLIEIPCSFLLIMPWKALQTIGAWLQISLQLLIMLTGNYNFFNVLTIVLMLPCISSDMNRADVIRGTAVICVGIAICCAIMFDFKMLDTSHVWYDNVFIAMRSSFLPLLNAYLPVACTAGLMFGVFGALLDWFTGEVPRKRSSVSRLLRSTLHFVFLLTTLAYMRCSLSSFNGITTVTAPTHPLLPQIESILRPFHVWSQYGLFRRMTGVGTPYSRLSVGGQPPAHVARPELVVEGLDPVSNTWLPIEFAYKPTSLTAAPRLTLTHQPRLDWQMWFAALGTYQHNPWLVHLVVKLMQPDAAAVRNLFDPSTNPFHSKPASMIRITRYDYDFTRWNTTWNRAVPGVDIVTSPESPWWSRRNGAEYLPAISGDHPSVAEFLRHHHITIRSEASAEMLYTACRNMSLDDDRVLYSVLRMYACEAIKLRDLLTRALYG